MIAEILEQCMANHLNSRSKWLRNLKQNNNNYVTNYLYYKIISTFNLYGIN